MPRTTTPGSCPSSLCFSAAPRGAKRCSIWCSDDGELFAGRSRPWWKGFESFEVEAAEVRAVNSMCARVGGAMTSRFSRDLRAALGDSFSIHRLGEQVFCWMVLQAATSLAEECKDII